MKSRLTAHFINLVYDATLKSFWRIKTLIRFLRECEVPQNLLNYSTDYTKREILDNIFAELKNHSAREPILARMATNLKEQSTFPDLEGWEDSAEKLIDAKRSIRNLKGYIEEQDKAIKDEEAQKHARKKHRDFQAKVRSSQQTLEDLNVKLTALVQEIGTQEGGYRFERWFFDLLNFYEISVRRPYKSKGRQIDGSLTILNTTYLVELKFTREPVGPESIDSFIQKVTTKADNTMGVFVSMSGFTKTAVNEASRDKTPVLLFDYTHIYQALGGIMSFPEIIERVRRHASQTGEAFLKADKFSG